MQHSTPTKQANFAYSRYSLIHPEIAALQSQIEQDHAAVVQATDAAFLDLWAAGEADKAQALIDEVRLGRERGVMLSINQINQSINRWGVMVASINKSIS